MTICTLSCCWFYHVNSPAVGVCWCITDGVLTSHFVPLKVDLNKRRTVRKQPQLCDRLTLIIKPRVLYLTSTTVEFFRALAISLVSTVNFFIRLKLASTDISTSAPNKHNVSPTRKIYRNSSLSCCKSSDNHLHPSFESSMSFLRKRSLWRLTSPNQNSTCFFTSHSSCLTLDLFFLSISLFLRLDSAVPSRSPAVLLSESIILRRHDKQTARWPQKRHSNGNYGIICQRKLFYFSILRKRGASH